LNEQLENGEEIDEEKAQEIADKYIEIADLDGNGTIDLEEMKAFMTKMEGASDDCEELFKSIDEDGDGEISKEEFAKAIIQVINDKKNGDDGEEDAE